MRSFRLIIIIILIGILNESAFSQISLSALKNAGINSEEDIKGMGISDDEITKAKEEFFKVETNKSNDSGIETTEVDEFKKKEDLKEITIPEVKLTSSKEIEKDDIYGHSIFSEGSVNIIKNSDRIKAPENYRLVAGDKLNVTIWGYSEFSGEFIVGESGNITPKLVGRINLKGKTFSIAKKIITSRFGKVYDLRNSQIAIDLSYSKVISVNVIGEVEKPGSYSIPSLNSVFNILSLAGGPTELGSIRSIEVRRGGELVKEIDVYEFMFSPRKFKNQYLQEGDFIVVNPIQGVVRIRGEVNRPWKYEFKTGDKYSDILKYSGGYSAMANTSAISITRVQNNELHMLSLNELLNGGKDFLLKNGDQIEVLKVSDLIRNTVSIKGAVRVPGHYPFKTGIKISDLISYSKGITYQAFTGIGHVYRLKDDLTYEIRSFKLGEVLTTNSGEDNLQLKEFDQIIIFNKDSFINEQTISISGMVNLPDLFEFRTGMTLEDLVLLSNGIKQEADLDKIEIERLVYKSKSENDVNVEIIELNYPKDKNYILKSFDRVHFRKLAGFTYQQTIEIKGEVKFPGIYSLKGNNDKISDLINRAGGTTLKSYAENSSIFRSEDSLGLVLLNLKKVILNDKSKFNYILKPGDVITIPAINDIVSIKGAIGFKFINGEDNIINSPFHKGKRANYYIEKYGGGYDEGAQKNKVHVVSSNGLVRRGRLFGWIKPKVKNGDQIIVNYKKQKKKNPKDEKIDWNNSIENFTIKLTGLATLWILLDRINP